MRMLGFLFNVARLGWRFSPARLALGCTRFGLRAGLALTGDSLYADRGRLLVENAKLKAAQERLASHNSILLRDLADAGRARDEAVRQGFEDRQHFKHPERVPGCVSQVDASTLQGGRRPPVQHF